MRLTELNQRGRIEQPSVTRDATYGSEQVAWVELATVWIGKQDVLPSKAEEQGQTLVRARNPARIRMRYRTDVTSAMRIVVLGAVERTYQIISGPAVLGNKEGIEVMAEELST